jgi:hypothetical protein
MTEHERNIYTEGFEKGQSFRFSKIMMYLSTGTLIGLIVGYLIH